MEEVGGTQTLLLNKLRDTLDAAINGKLCVRAWLGHADVLFLGFGQEVLPGIILGKGAGRLEQPEPPYKLRTHLSDWCIEHQAIGILGSSYDDKRAWASASSLVGRRAMGWQFTSSPSGLEIEFVGGLELRIKPYDGSQFLNEDAWSVRDPDGFYSMVTCNGHIYLVHGDEIPA